MWTYVRGGGQMVSVLTFYCKGSGLNPDEVYTFYNVKYFVKNGNGLFKQPISCR